MNVAHCYRGALWHNNVTIFKTVQTNVIAFLLEAIAFALGVDYNPWFTPGTQCDVAVYLIDDQIGGFVCFKLFFNTHFGAPDTLLANVLDWYDFQQVGFCASMTRRPGVWT